MITQVTDKCSRDRLLACCAGLQEHRVTPLLFTSFTIFDQGYLAIINQTEAVLGTRLWGMRAKFCV